MEKIDERWSPNEITSVFKVQCEGDRPLNGNKDLVKSEPCGLGWRFTAMEGNNASIVFGFDRHLVSHADFGPLTVFTGGLEKQYPFPQPEAEDDRFSFFAYYKTSIIIKNPVVSFTVRFPSSLGLALPNSISSEMMQAINKSLLGEEIHDTKFYVFSCRTNSRRACRPLPLFANRSLLRGHCIYLNILLSKETMIVDPLTAMPEILEAEYDYDSDSDLESLSQDEDEFDVVEQGSASSTMIIDDAAETLKPTELVNSVIVDSDKNNQRIAQSSSCIDGEGSRQGQVQGNGRSQRMGHMIVIKDAAFTTWKALLCYLYTNSIAFTPLKSKSQQEPSAEKPHTQTPPCSPKSMYRLASKVGIHHLKKLAFQAIISDLSKQNITQELFSGFTSRYPEIRKKELEVFCRYYSSPAVATQIRKILKKMSEGSLPHGPDVIVSLLEELEPRGGLRDEVESNDDDGHQVL